MDILFATDGRPPARAAAELLVRLVDPSQVQVTALHAFDYGNEIVADSVAEKALAEAETMFGGAGIPTHLISVAGDPAVRIEKELAHGGQDLTVMGAGNHTWLGRLVFGSVSTHMLHASPTPVMVVHRAPDPDHAKIHVLVGADGSPAMMHAIETLVRLTDPERTEIQVRSVVQTPSLAFAPYPGAVVPTTYVEALTQKAKTLATEQLEETLERIRSAGFTPHGSLGGGWPANDLVDLAERTQADLVVVGARGVGVVSRLTMGSVSSHVARHAPATLVAHARTGLPSEQPEGPNGDVKQSRFAVRWR